MRKYRKNMSKEAVVSEMKHLKRKTYNEKLNQEREREKDDENISNFYIVMLIFLTLRLSRWPYQHRYQQRTTARQLDEYIM